MAATAQVRYYTGVAGGTAGSDVIGTTIRYNRGDSGGTAAASVGLTGPVPLDAVNTMYSWRKSSRINFSTTPAGSITNLRWFAASIPANTELYAALDSSLTVTGYVQASSSDEGSAGNSGILGLADTGGNRTTNACSTNRTAGSPLTVVAGTLITNPTTGEGTQAFVVSQFAVTTAYAAGPGATSNFTLTYRYAET
jgi:hypothetical protein